MFDPDKQKVIEIGGKNLILSLCKPQKSLENNSSLQKKYFGGIKIPGKQCFNTKWVSKE